MTVKSQTYKENRSVKLWKFIESNFETFEMGRSLKHCEEVSEFTMAMSGIYVTFE